LGVFLGGGFWGFSRNNEQILVKKDWSMPIPRLPKTLVMPLAKRHPEKKGGRSWVPTFVGMTVRAG